MTEIYNEFESALRQKLEGIEGHIDLSKPTIEQMVRGGMGRQLHDNVLANAFGAAIVRWKMGELSNVEMEALVKMVNDGTGDILGLRLDYENKLIVCALIQELMAAQASEELVGYKLVQKAR